MRIFLPRPFLIATLAVCSLAAMAMPGELSAKEPTATTTDEQGSMSWSSRYAVSAAIGRINPRFHGEKEDDSVVFDYLRGGAQARFARGRWIYSLDNRDLIWRFQGIGRVGALHTGQQALPRIVDNRLEYRRGGWIEWYVNGPLGLQQGFTIEREPRGEGPLTLAFSLSGADVSMSVSKGGRMLNIQGERWNLSYGRLQVVDADGRMLPAWLEPAEEQTFRVRVADAGARYPLTIDPFIQQAKLTASDASMDDSFGVSVSVSGDTVVVGAEGENSAQGAAYVFEEPVSGWANTTETQKITAGDGASDDAFGVSVAVSGDTMVIGAEGDDSSRGAAYVFENSSGNWVESAKLTASDGASGDLFGAAVSISGDTAVVGAENDNTAKGASYVFVEPGGGWENMTETQKLTASDAANLDSFGVSVSISGDTILVGAEGDNSSQGGAYVFDGAGGSWSQTRKLIAGDGGSDDAFGTSVSISGDTLVVGADQDDSFRGSAYVFEDTDEGWTETGKLTATDASIDDAFGISVSISNDRIIVGANGDNSSQGAAYLFEKPVAGWTDTNETQKLVASDGAGSDAFGISVSIDGDTIVAGADGDESGRGAAYVFNQDTDGDGVPDSTDNCPMTANPDQTDSDMDGSGDACDPDDDNDGMTDTFENDNSLDPLDPGDANEDPDGDGLDNLGEFEASTDPHDPDSDGDGIGDDFDLEQGVSSNLCVEADAILSNQDILNDQVLQCAAENSIEVQSTVNIESGGRLELISPEVVVGNQFSIPTGGELGVTAADPTPSALLVIVTEIMKNPDNTSDSAGEWFELHNFSTDSFDLEGCVISDDSASHTIVGSLLISAGDYISLAVSDNPGFVPDYSYDGALSLSNGADSVGLECDNSVIDEVQYDDGVTFPDTAGAALNLDPAAFLGDENDDGDNWCDATSMFGNGDFGTPDASNDSCP